MIIDKAVALSKEFPDGSVIKYAFSAIIEIGIANEGIDSDDEAAERYFEDALLRYAYYYPTVIPLIQRWLPRVVSADSRVERRVERRVLKLLDRSFALAQSDNIVWCIYYLLQLSVHAHEDLPGRCINTNDPMVVLMGYIYAKKCRQSIRSFSEWAARLKDEFNDSRLTEYDLDRVWLPIYQLFFDGVIEEPPYTSDDDNSVFTALKEDGVSFIDFDHGDFGRRASNYAKKIFGER